MAAGCVASTVVTAAGGAVVATAVIGAIGFEDEDDAACDEDKVSFTATASACALDDVALSTATGLDEAVGALAVAVDEDAGDKAAAPPFTSTGAGGSLVFPQSTGELAETEEDVPAATAFAAALICFNWLSGGPSMLSFTMVREALGAETALFGCSFPKRKYAWGKIRVKLCRGENPDKVTL